MKLNRNILLLALGGSCLLPTLMAQQQPDRLPVATPKPVANANFIEVKNIQGEKLGRIRDLSVDLDSGRIIEVLVVSGEFFAIGGKTVSVPPLAFTSDATSEVYTLDVTKEVFDSAPEVDLSKWQAGGQSARIAAAYRLFGQEPYFLTPGEASDASAKYPKTEISLVERMSKINGMDLSNLQGEDFGSISSISMDIPKGRITRIVVLFADDFFKTPEAEGAVVSPDTFDVRCVVPSTVLRLNATGDGVVIDSTKLEFAKQPRLTQTEPNFNNRGTTTEEVYQGPRTAFALEQGTSEFDMELTATIKKAIREAKINARRVQIGTLDGRVTLRGSTATDADRTRIAMIAVLASRLEVVDNQMISRQPKTR